MKSAVFDYESLGENVQLLIKAVDQTGDHIMITDKEGAIKYVNPAFEKTTGFSKFDVLDKTPRILKSGVHEGIYYEKLWATILRGNTFRARTTNRKRNGELYIANQTITSITDVLGQITHFVSVWKDITNEVAKEIEFAQLHKDLEFEKYKLEQILNFDEQVSATTNLHTLIDFTVKKACEILEAKSCSLMLFDESTKELCIKGARGLDERFIKSCRIKMGEEVSGRVAEDGKSLLVRDIDLDQRIPRWNRESYESKSFLSVPMYYGEKLLGVINVTNKISGRIDYFDKLDLKVLSSMAKEVAVAFENAKLYRKLNYLSVTDPLTHIHNYRYFMSSLQYEIDRAERFCRPLAVIMADVDDFKSYNDHLGHLAGDVLLKEISQVFRNNLRSIDILCRYAGDEFVIILPESDSQGAVNVAEKIKKRIAALSFERPVSISMGVARYANGMSRHDFILKTDRALYQAKHDGKNQVCIFV